MCKWVPLNPIQSQRGRGLIFRNGNTSNLSASTTPTGKLYFCSQALAVMVKTMEMYKWVPLNPILSQRGDFIFRNGNTSSFSASTTPTRKLYFCSQALPFMVKAMEMFKQAALNPIQPQGGWGLYFQKWKYFKPFRQHHTHRQTLFLFSNIGCDGKNNWNI